MTAIAMSNSPNVKPPDRLRVCFAISVRRVASDLTNVKPAARLLAMRPASSPEFILLLRRLPLEAEGMPARVDHQHEPYERSKMLDKRRSRVGARKSSR